MNPVTITRRVAVTKAHGIKSGGNRFSSPKFTQRTGGKAYWARTWQKQVEALEDVREEMSNAYTVTYYPATNPNEGFRKLTVEMVNNPGKKMRIKYRPGYRPSKVI